MQSVSWRLSSGSTSRWASRRRSSPLRFVPESPRAQARRPDPLGQLLVIALFGSLTYAIIEAPESGAGPVAPFAVLAVAALLALLWYEPRRARPLIDLRFSRSAPFSGATVSRSALCAALGGFLFLSTLYLQNVRGLDALHAGLWMLPMAVPTFLCAHSRGRLVGTRGPRVPLLVAGTAMTASGVLFAAFEAETADATPPPRLRPLWHRLGFVNAPITDTAVSGMPRAQAGVAAAVASTSRQLGQTLGVAVVGAVLASGIGASPVPRVLRLGRPPRLVDPHRLRPGRPRPRPPDQRPLGPPHRGTHGAGAWSRGTGRQAMGAAERA